MKVGKGVIVGSATVLVGTTPSDEDPTGEFEATSSAILLRAELVAVAAMSAADNGLKDCCSPGAAIVTITAGGTAIFSCIVCSVEDGKSDTAVASAWQPPIKKSRNPTITVDKR